MSVLSDIRILEKIYDKELEINPFVSDHIQPSSIDLTLDSNIRIPKRDLNKSINVFEDDLEKYYNNQNIDKYVLEPGEMILAEIKETIYLSNNMTGRIENRNSIIRLGINVSLSGYINPGYRGKLPIVIHNIGTFSVELASGMRICQLVISDVAPAAHMDYSQKEDAKYFNEKGIELSKLYLDKEFNEYIKKFNVDDGKEINREHLSNYFHKRLQSKSTKITDILTDDEKRKVGLI